MRFSISFPNYNARRYSQPWIAKISKWEIGERPNLEFGGYIGDSSGGEVEIEAKPDDIIKWGQKDYRGKKSESFIGIAMNDGTISEITSIEAAKHWREIHS